MAESTIAAGFIEHGDIIKDLKGEWRVVEDAEIYNGEDVRIEFDGNTTMFLPIHWRVQVQTPPASL